MSGLPQRSSAAASPNQDHRSQPMSQRKIDDTATPTEPAKPDPPAAQRRRVVYWDDPDAPEPLSPEQWDHFVQEMADAGKSVPNSELVRSRLGQARELWQRGQERERRAQAREQERTRQEQQERERQAQRIGKLELSRLDLEERLDAIRALIDKAIDGVNVQANLIAAKALTARQRAAGERSGEVRANKPWHVAARKIINDNPKLGHAALVRKIEKDGEPPVTRRAVEQFVTDELLRK
jgi:hypothetical protein